MVGWSVWFTFRFLRVFFSLFLSFYGGIFTFRFLPVYQSRLLTPAEEEEEEAAAAEEEEEEEEGGMCVVGWGGDGFRFRTFDNNSG